MSNFSQEDRPPFVSYQSSCFRQIVHLFLQNYFRVRQTTIYPYRSRTKRGASLADAPTLHAAHVSRHGCVPGGHRAPPAVRCWRPARRGALHGGRGGRRRSDRPGAVRDARIGSRDAQAAVGLRRRVRRGIRAAPVAPPGLAQNGRQDVLYLRSYRL